MDAFGVGKVQITNYRLWSHDRRRDRNVIIIIIIIITNYAQIVMGGICESATQTDNRSLLTDGMVWYTRV